MKKKKTKIFSHILNVVLIALIIECFLCAMMLVNMYAKDDCYDRIVDASEQVSDMYRHSLEERQLKLTMFADILAANSKNPDDLLQTYMKGFCQTQDFSGVCIHRADGSEVSYGSFPHDEVKYSSYIIESKRLPYISGVISLGDSPKDNYIYQAVPIVRSGETVGILYGYMSLDIMPRLVVTNAFDSKCRLSIIDGETGSYLLDEYSGTLGSIYDKSQEYVEIESGYNVDSMLSDIKNGNNGFFVYRSQSTDEWNYIYYMPIGINNWSLQLEIDEPTAFKVYNDVSHTMLALMVLVVLLMVAHILTLTYQSFRVNKRDSQNLHRSNYIAEVQRALINAHNNPDFVDRALKIVGVEMKAETVLLLSFSDKTVTSAQYWPSTDKAQAMDLVGRNIRDDFPVLFDMLASRSCAVYDVKNKRLDISGSAERIFELFDVRNLMLAPIMDNAGSLKGAVAAVNLEDTEKGAEMLECVTYDFFMAITNLENHNIIKKMGEMDYLTGVKNRNSYEAALGEYVTMEAETLWCVFVDVNGLHDVNNSHGHKAGDIMLCAVADAVKRAFGESHTYRIGGDEFVAFAKNSSHEELLKKKRSILAELAVKGYYVSVGFERAVRTKDDIFDIERLISAAERIMYHDKRDYYERNKQLSDRSTKNDKATSGINE